MLGALSYIHATVFQKIIPDESYMFTQDLFLEWFLYHTDVTLLCYYALFTIVHGHSIPAFSHCEDPGNIMHWFKKLSSIQYVNIALVKNRTYKEVSLLQLRTK